jgi:hypothetical protein
VTPEERAELLHRDIVQLCGQVTSWWQFRRRRLIQQEIAADLIAIQRLQDEAGRPLLR